MKYYRAELDFSDYNERENNPVFYLTDSEKDMFIELCSKNNYEIFVKQVSEAEYMQHVKAI